MSCSCCVRALQRGLQLPSLSLFLEYHGPIVRVDNLILQCFEGREAPGKAYRLYTEETFLELRAATVPEIQQVRLTAVVLQLKALGVSDPLTFDFMDKPPLGSLLR